MGDGDHGSLEKRGNMRTWFVALLAMLMLFLLAVPASATDVVRDSDGSYKLGCQDANCLDITVSPEAWMYDGAWREALTTNKSITIQTSYIEYPHHFLVVTVVSDKKVVVYDPVRRVIEVRTVHEKKTESSIDPFFILDGIAIALVLISITSVKFGKKGIAPALLAVPFAVFAFFAYAAVVTVTAAAFFGVFFFAFFVFGFLVFGDKEMRLTVSAVFCVILVVAGLIRYFY
jgi:hypothetical protein